MQLGRANLRPQLSNNIQKLKIRDAIYKNIIRTSTRFGLVIRECGLLLACDDPSIYNVCVSICGLMKDTFLETL